MKKAVILLSGGLDSTTCMAVAKEQGYDLYPISFDYHQRHSIELEGAKKIADFYQVKKHLIIETNMDQVGGSALTIRIFRCQRGRLFTRMTIFL